MVSSDELADRQTLFDAVDAMNFVVVKTQGDAPLTHAARHVEHSGHAR